MTTRLFFFLALALQAGFFGAWAWTRRASAKDGGGGGLSRPVSGRLARMAGLLGAGCGLVYAALARDPVFFLGQAVAVILAGRLTENPSRPASPGGEPGAGQAGRKPG